MDKDLLQEDLYSMCKDGSTLQRVSDFIKWHN